MSTIDSGSSSSSGSPTVGAEEDLSRNVVLDVLSNDRRRYVVHFLKYHDEETVDLGTVAEQVASWELDKPVEKLDYKERKRVKNALRQFHLPKMEETGFVEYREREGVVGLTDAAARQDFYVDVLPTRGIPWGMYYLGLSAVGLTGLAGLALGIPPFDLLPAVGWYAFLVVTLVVSSIGHFYDNYYRMRLGAKAQPPDFE